VADKPIMGFLDFILGQRQPDPDRGNQPAPGTDNTLNTARTPQSDNSTDIKNFPVKNSELLTNLRFVDRSFNTLEEINAKLESAKKAFPLDAEKFETIKNQSHNLIINLNSYVEELLPNLRTGYSISAYETAQESLVKEPEVFKAARDKQLSIDNIEVSPDASIRLQSFIEHVHTVITIHGFGRQGYYSSLLLGGQHRTFAQHVGSHLRTHLPAYKVITDIDEIPKELRGLHPRNPVNLPPGAGVQIELPPRVRGTTPLFWDWEGPSLPPHTESLISGLVSAVNAWTMTTLRS
jgi:phage replication-related protein YjqB (UPF0714/DUF867 family)